MKKGMDRLRDLLEGPVWNIGQSFYDQYVEANVRFRQSSGFRMKIIRRQVGKCCDWCAKLSGIYYADKAPDDIYRRHDNCKCMVTTTTEKGDYRDVWSKKEYSSQREARVERQRMILDELNKEEFENLAKIEKRIEVEQKTALIKDAQNVATTNNNHKQEILERIKKEILPNMPKNKIVQRQEVHRKGSKLFLEREAKLRRKNQYGPSYLTISDDEVLELVRQYSGSGIITYTEDGVDIKNIKEVIIDNDKIVGVVYNNLTGEYTETSVFKIHYSQDGIHIVPDYPSKKKNRRS